MVLGVHESVASLSFDLDAVLTEQHPRWEPCKPGEQYTYRRLTLTFPNMRRVEWLDRGGPPAVDATGERNGANIDTFATDRDTYELTGGWVHGRVESDPPQVRDQ